MIKKYFLLCIFLSSCSGYRFKNNENPFGQYAIRSISIPMFYNKSNFANVSSVFTKEIYKSLLDFKGLRINSGLSSSDAVLIGVIESDERKKSSVSAQSSKNVTNTYGSNVLGKKRDDFVVTSVNLVRLWLRIVVIKHPSTEELKFLQRKVSLNAISSKIIFNERILLTGSYQLKELRGDASKVIAIQNRGVEKKKIALMAKQAAVNFKDMMLYAF